MVLSKEMLFSPVRITNESEKVKNSSRRRVISGDAGEWTMARYNRAFLRKLRNLGSALKAMDST